MAVPVDIFSPPLKFANTFVIGYNVNEGPNKLCPSKRLFL